MLRRIVPAVAAVLIAGLGAFFLYNYVNTADRRAMAGQELVDVLVVAKTVPNETPAEKVAPYLQLRQLPRTAVAPGALATLAEVTGLATTSELQVGEQVLGARFAAPGTSSDRPGVVVPADRQEVSVQLESQRVVGSTLAAGDRVAVYFTVKEKTKLRLPDVLVTNVQGGLTAEAAEEGAAPSGDLMLTLALKARDVERVVFAAEAGRLWLSRVSDGSADQTTSGTTEKNVFK